MVNDRIYAYENDQLEDKYPDFKNLINEYSAGILVFEIMQDEIWQKASKDTAGIRAYFNNHREDFMYDKRYKGDLFICKDKKTAKAVIKMLKTGKLKGDEIVKMINNDSQLNIELRSQTFNADKTSEFFVTSKNGKKVTKKSFKEGINKAYKRNDEYYVMNVEEILPARQREFSEAKGLVTAAYQNQLEKEWIKSLRSKYSIKIHSENLYNLKAE
jgi:peptidyl-prolyl cis-trans isomerase SurA